MTDYERRCIEEAIARLNAALEGEPHTASENHGKADASSRQKQVCCREAPRRRNPFLQARRIGSATQTDAS